MNKRIVTVLAALSACFVAATAHAQYRSGYHGGGSNGNSASEFRASGIIDDKVDIILHGDRATYRTLSGDNTLHEAALRLNRPLPRRNVTVRVDKQAGRGRVWVVQQPRRENDYTAIIRVYDSQSGAGRYDIVANW